jgi:hypothetical protein
MGLGLAAVVVPFPRESRGRPPWRVRKGKSPAKRLLKAPILLKADVSELDEGWSDGEIIKALNTNAPLVYLVRKQLVEDGFEAALSRKQRTTPATSRIFDGEKEPRLIALACSTPPKGYGRCTLRLLEKKVVELEIVESTSDNTIGQTQKKMLKPRVKEQWVIPPQENSAFVAAMEDVLDVYQRPRDPIRPSIRCVSTRRSTPSRGAVPGFIRARLRMGWLPAGRGCGWM